MTLSRLARTIADWEWLILIVILPAVILVSPARSAVLLVIPLLWLARKIDYGRFVPATPVDWSIFFLLLMVLVSLYATFDVAFSLPKIAGMVLGVAVFYAVVFAAGRSSRSLWLAVALFLAGGLGVVGLSLLGVQWSAKLPLLGPLTQRLPERLLSIPGRETGFSPNEVSGVLLWIAPLSLVLAVAATLRRQVTEQWPRRWRPLLLGALWLAAIILCGALILTQSRAGLLGFGLALFFAALVGGSGRTRWLLFAVGVVIVAGSAVVAATGAVDIGDLLFTQAGLQAEGDAVATLEGRREIWSRALYGIQDFPFTGMGLNTFRRVVHILYPLFLIPPDTDIAHAHNHLLQAALDLGLPGLVAYLALWFGAAGMLWRSWQDGQDPGMRALALGYAASLLAYFIYGMVDAVALGARPAFLFWYLLGLVTGLYLRVQTAEEPEKAVAG